MRLHGVVPMEALQALPARCNMPSNSKASCCLWTWPVHLHEGMFKGVAFWRAGLALKRGSCSPDATECVMDVGLQTRLRILQEANEGLTAAAAASRARGKGPNGTPPLKGALRGALQALNGLPGALRDRSAAADARRKAARLSLALPAAGARVPTHPPCEDY